MSENKEVEQVEDVKQVEQVSVPEVAEDLPAVATLSSLIIDLHTVLDEARNLIVRYQQALGQLVDREKSIVSRETSVQGRESNLLNREEACNKVENLVSLESNAKALLDTANLRINAAVEAERSLNLATQQETAKLADLRILAQREANAVVEQRKAIESEVSDRVTKTLQSMGFNPSVKQDEPNKE